MPDRERPRLKPDRASLESALGFDETSTQAQECTVVRSLDVERESYRKKLRWEQ